MLNLLPQLQLERCPHCGVDRPNLTQKVSFETSDHVHTYVRVWGGYACARCGGVVFASALKHDRTAQVHEFFPSPQQVDEAIPPRAREYLSQALNSINAPAGAIMLTASAIDAMLKEKGYSDGSLYSRIDKAAADHIITSEMALWAHEVRLDANEQRHADEEAELPTLEDAQRALDFAMALGQFMFVLPSRVRRGIEDAKAGDK